MVEVDFVVQDNWLVLWQISGVIYFGFWIYSIYHLVNADFKDYHSKLVWALITIFLPFGCFLYLGSSKRYKKRNFNPDFKTTTKPN